MYKNVLNHIDGIAIFPIFSLVMFVMFFVALGFWVFKADKSYVSYMEKLPFEKEGEKQ